MSNSSDLQLRLERLERSYRQFRWFAALAVLLVGLFPYFDALLNPIPAVEATKFILKDSTGRVRGRMASQGEDVFLQFYNVEGGLQAVLEGGGRGGALTLFDDRGNVRCSAAAQTRASIVLYDGQGEIVFSAPESKR